MTRAYLTGATGMLGATLAQELLAQGVSVIALIRPDTARSSALPEDPNLTVLSCGLDGYATLPAEEATLDPGAVFYHLAWGGTNGPARHDPMIQAQNVVSTLEAVRLAHRLGCGRFVGIGSQAEYGPSASALGPASPTHPTNAYGAAKLAAGMLGAMEARQLSMDFLWARVFSVYGPMDQPGALVRNAVEKLLSGEAPRFTRAEQQWDLLFSGDAALALRLIGEKGVSGAVYCVGSGVAEPLCGFIREIYRQLAPTLEPPLGTLPYAPDQVMYLEADIRSLTRDTGFRPQVPFSEGLRLTIQWCKEHHRP